jgi:hypothetical protein
MSVQLFGRVPRRLLDRGVQAALGRGAHFQFLPETPDPSAGNSYQLTPRAYVVFKPFDDGGVGGWFESRCLNCLSDGKFKFKGDASMRKALI